MKKVYVIAEAEINHNGDFEVAKKMIKSASECGADCVKFQYIVAEEIAEKDSEYFKLFKNAELTLEEFVLLKEYAENTCSIDFMITAPSRRTYDRLKQFGFNKIKIGSSNLSNSLLFRHIASNRSDDSEELFISTGTGTLLEISAAIESLRVDESDNNLTIFHCTSVYPAPVDELNLSVISKLVNLYPGINIGYSDHTLGSMAAIVAVSLGASVVEKHFTLDKAMDGPDHSFSSDPEEFNRYIKDIRDVERSWGDGVKKPSKSEKKIVNNIRRYLVFNQCVDTGSELNYKMFDTRRIGNDSFGKAPVRASDIEIINKLKSRKQYNSGDILSWNDFGS